MGNPFKPGSTWYYLGEIVTIGDAGGEVLAGACADVQDQDARVSFFLSGPETEGRFCRVVGRDRAAAISFLAHYYGAEVLCREADAQDFHALLGSFENDGEFGTYAAGGDPPTMRLKHHSISSLQPDGELPGVLPRAFALLTRVDTEDASERLLPAVRSEVFEVPSNQVVWEVARAMGNQRACFSSSGPDGRPEAEIRSGNWGNGGTVKIKADTAEQAWKQVQKLDAGTLDSLLALFSLFSEDRRRREEIIVRDGYGAVAQGFYRDVDVDTVLEMRGVKPHPHGGYRYEQRVAVAQDFHSIGRIHIDVEVARPGKRGPHVRLDGTFFTFGDSIEDVYLDGRPSVKRIHRVTPGAITEGLGIGGGGGLISRQTGILAAATLARDPQQGRVEKLLALYLAVQFRISAKESNFERDFYVETILREIGLEIEARNPHRTLERLHKALDNLVEDRAIASWSYKGEGGPAALRSIEPDGKGQHGRLRHNWRAAWLNSSLLISAPDAARERYASIGSGCQPAALLPPPDDPKSKRPRGGPLVSPDRVRAARMRCGLTQVEAAARAGVRQQSLSRAERGRPLGSRDAGKIRTWVEQVEARG